MDFADILKAQNISVYRLSRDTGIPYSTLYDIVNGKTALYNVSFGDAGKIADALSLTLEELRNMAERANSIDLGDHEHRIIVKGKKYYLVSQNSEPILLGTATVATRDCIAAWAQWGIEEGWFLNKDDMVRDTNIMQGVISQTAKNGLFRWTQTGKATTLSFVWEGKRHVIEGPDIGNNPSRIKEYVAVANLVISAYKDDQEFKAEVARRRANKNDHVRINAQG